MVWYVVVYIENCVGGPEDNFRPNNLLENLTGFRNLLCLWFITEKIQIKSNKGKRCKEGIPRETCRSHLRGPLPVESHGDAFNPLSNDVL